mmetsp:Transcript_6180/g.11014  ORF Transcript_6180/g.11014 Transcript_6180/m.11014 type:complete len:221 (-) Transcript_6180:639-1301(-)
MAAGVRGLGVFRSVLSQTARVYRFQLGNVVESGLVGVGSQRLGNSVWKSYPTMSSMFSTISSTTTPQSHVFKGADATTAGELVTSKGSTIRTCTEDQLVIDAVKTMVAANIGSLIVVRGSKPVGIVTERDYLEKVIVLGRHSDTTKVKDIMSVKGLVSVPPSFTLQQCMDLMAAHHVTHLPVIENESLKGLISIGDVVRDMVKAYNAQASAMGEYIAGSY